MNPSRSFLLFLTVFLSSVVSFAQDYNLEADLTRLDVALASAESHVRSKEQLLTSMEKLLENSANSPRQKLTVYKQLFLECYPYSFDKALDAANMEEEIAARLSQEDKSDALLDKALLLATAGLYMEAQEVVDKQIDTTCLTQVQEAMYHYVMQRYWKDYGEYSGWKIDGDKVWANYKYHKDQYLEKSDPDAFWHRMLMVFNLIDEDRNYEADAICLKLIKDLDPNSHHYAIACYYEGVISEKLGHNDDRMHWFIESAIADVNQAVKDNASLSSIANLLLEDDVERASRYLQISMEDALAYNAKLRPWQIARLFPDIEAAYKTKQDEIQHKSNVMLCFVIASIILLLAIVALLLHLLRKMKEKNAALRAESQRYAESQKELAEANAKLKVAFAQVSEANRAKREYIALFLTMCSGYIDKLKKFLTPAQKEEEFANFYKAFDNAFIQLYPNFVEEFNALLKPEARVVLKKDEVLNTELRIFALIRLGITQSSHIASLLRYSVNTIYNYRAQVKNSALDERSDFEDMVRNIGNVEI